MTNKKASTSLLLKQIVFLQKCRVYIYKTLFLLKYYGITSIIFLKLISDSHHIFYMMIIHLIYVKDRHKTKERFTRYLLLHKVHCKESYKNYYSFHVDTNIYHTLEKFHYQIV